MRWLCKRWRELSEARVCTEFEGLHALDIMDAIVRAIDAPRETVHGDVLNVGSTEQNYTIRDIAKVVDEVFTGCGIFGEPSADHRGHRVALDEIRSVLPSFDCAVHAVEIRLVEDADVLAHRANRGKRVVEQPVDVEPCVNPITSSPRPTSTGATSAPRWPSAPPTRTRVNSAQRC
jgi:hypothetical protein